MVMRRRRPLVRGAMVAGTAYYVGSKTAQAGAQDAQQQQQIEQLQSQQAAQQQPPPPYQQAPQYQQPAPQPPAAPVEVPPSSMDTMAEQLTQLKALLDKGILTQEEFDEQKAKILNG